MQEIAGCSPETRIPFMEAPSDWAEIATHSPEIAGNRVETAFRSREMTGQAIAFAITPQKTASYAYEPVPEAGRNTRSAGHYPARKFGSTIAPSGARRSLRQCCKRGKRIALNDLVSRPFFRVD